MPIPRMTHEEEILNVLHQVFESSEFEQEQYVCMIEYLTYTFGKNPIKNLVDLYHVFYGWLVVLEVEKFAKNNGETLPQRRSRR